MFCFVNVFLYFVYIIVFFSVLPFGVINDNNNNVNDAGAAGLIVSVNRVVTKALMRDVTDSTLLFFGVSIAFVVVCCAAFHVTRCTDFVRFYVSVCRSSAVGDDQRAIMRPSTEHAAAAAAAAAGEEVSLVSASFYSEFTPPLYDAKRRSGGVNWLFELNVKPVFHGGSFPRSILVTSMRGCHRRRKMVPWNLSLRVSLCHALIDCREFEHTKLNIGTV